MDATLIALGGVAAGAVASGSVQSYLTRADRRRDARSGARLLYMHLHGAVKAVEDLRQEQAWAAMITDWDAYANVWDQHSEKLARQLNTSQFATVSAAFGCLGSLALARRRDLEEAMSRGTPPGFDPPDKILDRYVLMIKSAERVALKSSFRWWEWRVRKKALES